MIPPSAFTVIGTPPAQHDGIVVSNGTVVATVLGNTGTFAAGGTFVAVPNPGTLSVGRLAPSALVLAAQTALDSGITITSTGSGTALNGVYACNPVTGDQLTAVSQYITVNGAFPAGMTTFAWPDIAGNKHVFTTTTEFQAFASAIASYAAQLTMIINGMSSDTALPAATATIP